MSGINQSTAVNIEDPEFYTESLMGTSRISDRRLLSNEPLPGIPYVDPPLTRRLQTLLDVVADISICRRGNVSAAMASLKDYKGTLKTEIYMAFNHENDKAVSTCRPHLESIIKKLQKVPYTTQSMDGSPKVIEEELEDNLIGICEAIDNFSFEVFAHRVNKRKKNLSTIMTYIQNDQTKFSPESHSILLDFFDHVGVIIQAADDAQATKQLPTSCIRMLSAMQTYWMDNNLLLKDTLARDHFTLL